MQTKIFEWNRAGNRGTNRLFSADVTFYPFSNQYSVIVGGRELKEKADCLASGRNLAEVYAKKVMLRLLGQGE